MANRRRIIPTLMTAVLIALCLPAMAAAQGGYNPWWGRDQNNRRNDNYRYGRYDRRQIRDSVRRVEDRSGNFKNHIDSALDRSRYDDTRREDRINEVAEQFHRAANRLEDRYDDGRDLSRSSNEARNLLQLGSQIDRFVARNRLGGRAASDWSQIRQDLRVIADAYGFNLADFNDGRNRRDDRVYRRGNDDRYRRGYPWQ